MWYRMRLTLDRLHPYFMLFQLVFFLFISVFVWVQPADALIRLGSRSLMVMSSEPGVVTTYKMSFYYTTPANIGSVDMKFCMDPIPYMPCDTPTGLDVSSAVLSDQTGETGYSITQQSTNHILLSRPPASTGSSYATYTFTGITNPTEMSHSFAIRLETHTSSDGTGAIVNLGSILSQIERSILLETQVPPLLIFCLADAVTPDCTTVSNGEYNDMGELTPDVTNLAVSQMGVGTNASGGYAITIHGTTMAAGTHVIDALDTPTISAKGNNQFGINLVENTQPVIGQDPDGASSNAIVEPNYATPNKFMYHDGDLIASAPNVSLIKRFTTSYVVNSSPNLRAGVYTTTVTYICTGRF